MKYIVIVPDGASDHPIEVLGDRTPLEVANTPFMDSLAKKGFLGRVRTVPPQFKPSSDVANLSLLGYDPEKYYTGRGPLEAANLGIELEEDDLALRCNFITEADGKMVDYSAGHITNKESHILLNFLDKKLGTDKIKFYSGQSYRNVVVFKNSADFGLDSLKYSAPHDIMEKPINEYLPKGKGNQIIVDLMYKSCELLASHEINKVRIDLGENPASMIWLWGCGKKPKMETFEEKFRISGAVISAVDLINGIGRIAEMKVIDVQGATGYYDTNYLGKAYAALEALNSVDFIFVHIEAPDEAGHNGDLRMKITCLERIDKMVVGTILENLKYSDYRIMITPDHPTPVLKRTHTNEPVPFLIYGKGIETGNFSSYSEAEAQNSPLYFDKGTDLLKHFLKK